MTRRVFAFAVVCAVIVFAAAVAARDDDEGSDDDSKRGAAKLEWLLQKSKQSPFIWVTGETFDEYIGKGPRPYTILAFITSNSGNCQMCRELRPEVSLLADSLEESRYTVQENGSEDVNHTVFVMEVDGSRNFEFFQKLGLSTVPHLVVVPPQKNSKRKRWEKTLENKVAFSRGMSAEDIARSLRSRIDFEVKINRPPERPDYLSIMFTLTVGAGTIIFCATIGLPFLQKYVFNPVVFLTGSLLFYGFCMSGGMYNRLRDSPFMHQSQNGEPEFIYRGSGGQYIVESYIIGGLYIFTALAVIVMNTKAHSIKATYWTRQALIMACLFSFFLLWRQLRGIYSIKNGGYNMGWVWSLRNAFQGGAVGHWDDF